MVAMNALLLDRIHFAFTVTFHYLFPQLTMGPLRRDSGEGIVELNLGQRRII